MAQTNFERITTSMEDMATFLTSLPVMSGPWDAAFDKHFCATCGVQDCNAEGCPHQEIRAAVIPWWLGMASEEVATDECGL